MKENPEENKEFKGGMRGNETEIDMKKIL